MVKKIILLAQLHTVHFGHSEFLTAKKKFTVSSCFSKFCLLLSLQKLKQEIPQAFFTFKYLLVLVLVKW